MASNEHEPGKLRQQRHAENAGRHHHHPGARTMVRMRRPILPHIGAAMAAA
jgi:hypothetical protein